VTKTGNILKVAFRALARNKLRSLLTSLGIIIGVACVVAVELAPFAGPGGM
jgi:Fe2+ transport system protein FeoA